MYTDSVNVWRMALFQYFKKVDKSYPGTNLPDPQGALLKEVCTLVFNIHSKRKSCSHTAIKVVKGTYVPQDECWNEAEIG